MKNKNDCWSLNAQRSNTKNRSCDLWTFQIFFYNNLFLPDEKIQSVETLLN